MDSASLLVSTAVMRQAIDNGSAAVALKTVTQAHKLAEQFGEQTKTKLANCRKVAHRRTSDSGIISEPPPSSASDLPSWEIAPPLQGHPNPHVPAEARSCHDLGGPSHGLGNEELP